VTHFELIAVLELGEKMKPRSKIHDAGAGCNPNDILISLVFKPNGPNAADHWRLDQKLNGSATP
jgi:hypothetical protein